MIIFEGYKFSWFSWLPSNPRKLNIAQPTRSVIIIHSCFARSANCFLLYHKSALPPSSLSKRPCKCGTFELIVEMRNQYTEYRICFAVRTGESTKINSTKITNLSYFWKSTKIYSLENSLPYGSKSYLSKAIISKFTMYKYTQKHQHRYRRLLTTRLRGKAAV